MTTMRLHPIQTLGLRYLGTQRFVVETQSAMFVDGTVLAFRDAMCAWCEASISSTWYGGRTWTHNDRRTRFEFNRAVDAMALYIRWNGATS